MNTTHLIIVVPCYNEESVLPETIRQLSGVLNRMLENGKIVESGTHEELLATTAVKTKPGKSLPRQVKQTDSSVV